MEKTTKRTRNKPADETPANNDAGGVVDDARALAFFTIGVEADRLPPIDDPRGPGRSSLGALADVAYFSGYFPGLTPAQLAIKILTGIYLEADPMVALFDLVIEPGGRVGWKDNRRAASANTEPAFPAAAFDVDSNPIGTVIEFRRPIDENPIPKAGRQEPGGVIVDVATGEAVELADGESLELEQPEPGEANRGPLTETESEPGQPSPQTVNDDAGPQSGELAAESEPANDDALGFPTEPAATDPFESPAEPETVDQEFDRVTAADPPAITPAAALRASSLGPETLAGIEVGATIATWRNSIERWIRELEFAMDVVVVKLSKFDQATTTEKKTMFDQAKGLYEMRLSTKRGDVLLALARDGKTSLEQMAGTFAYFEVPDDPETWTYTDAIKAFRIIESETPKLLEPEPAAAKKAAK